MSKYFSNAKENKNNENIEINTNLSITDVSKIQIAGGNDGQVLKSNGDNSVSWIDSLSSSLISSSQLESYTYDTNSTITSDTTLVDVTDNSFTASKTGLLMIFFNATVQTESSNNVRFGLKLTIYKNDTELSESSQPKEVYSEGESSSYAPDLHTLSTSKQINVTKDDVIKYKVDLTF